jgi:hypothetical protein
MVTEQSLRIAAQAWCKPTTEHLEMQPEIAEAFAEILDGITPKQAIAALTKAMKEDYGYAWAWHCNIAMAAIDAGAPHKEANERAAGFMRTLFGVDTTREPMSTNVK